MAFETVRVQVCRSVGVGCEVQLDTEIKVTKHGRPLGSIARSGPNMDRSGAQAQSLATVGEARETADQFALQSGRALRPDPSASAP